MNRNVHTVWNKQLVFIICFVFMLQPLLAEHRPEGLTISFLSQAGQVFLNGYPVPVLLEDAVSRREAFQFTEIARKKPFFGWIVPSTRNNTMQTAYQVLVASSLDNITNDIGDFWNSGKVESTLSVNVVYEGKALQPDKVYFWKVKTWDNHGVESDFSEVSRFKTATKLVDHATDRYPLQKQDEYPKRIINKDVIFIDFGMASFGRLRLTLYSEKGGKAVKIHLGECEKNSRVDRNPGGTIRYSAYELILKSGWNTYVVAISPDGRNTGPRAIKMPEYIGEVMPFRYCEIEGYNEPLALHQVVCESVFYPFNETESYFSSSDTVLNQVWDLCKYSMKATSFTGVYVDGDRERIPYEADAYINQLGHYGVAKEYSIARYSHEYLINNATWPTEWILQSVLMAWNDYLYTGNSESLAYFYNNLKAKTLTSLADETGFISTRTGKVTPEVLKSIHLNDKLNDIVDWPQSGILGLGKSEPGETDGFVFQDINAVVNAYHYKSLEVMSVIAGVLGFQSESKDYKAKADKLYKAFNDNLLDKRRGIYVDGIGTTHSSLHANMFPMTFGLVPAKNMASVNEFVSSRGMACSVYGSQFLLDAVYDGNNGEYGLELLTSTAERSWYNMIRVGSTISLEAWDNKYKPNQDWNHAWGAAPANAIPRKLMGIEPMEPGFSKIRIKPQPATLKQAEIKCPTIRGDVYVSFENDHEKSFKLNISIPANSTANVYLPLWSKTQKVNGKNMTSEMKRQGDFVIIENVGPGTHSFYIEN